MPDAEAAGAGAGEAKEAEPRPDTPISRILPVKGRRAVAVSLDGGGLAILDHEQLGTFIDELIEHWASLS